MNKRSITVELVGIGLPNRGAELLARTVIQQITKHIPNSTFCTRMRISAQERAKLNILYCIGHRESITRSLRRTLNKLTAGKFRSERYKQGMDTRIGFIHESEVDIVVDISGFAYGDFWGSDKAKSRLTDRLAYWKQNNTPLVILPQAFGPFETGNFKAHLKPALEYAQLICARDQESKHHLGKLTSSVQIYPDITFSLAPQAKMIPKTRRISLFIPNMKVLESGVLSKAEYSRIARQFVQASRDQNITPYILNHEGQKDLDLCTSLGDELNVEVLDPENAILIKELIGYSDFIFSSRYHGVVTGLATSTPVATLGWSHKYKELMTEFDLQEMVIDESEHSAKECFRKLSNPNDNEQIRAKISSHLPDVRNRLNEMWRRLFNIIDNHIR